MKIKIILITLLTILIVITGCNKEENENPVIGNYLRIILRDTDDTVVENVEDYMKLDDGEVKSQELDDEKFLFWMGCCLELYLGLL